MNKTKNKILDLVTEFRKPKSVRNGISHECKKIYDLMNEGVNEKLQELKAVLENRIDNLKERKKEVKWMGYDWEQYSARISELRRTLETIDGIINKKGSTRKDGA